MQFQRGLQETKLCKKTGSQLIPAVVSYIFEIPTASPDSIFCRYTYIK